MEKPKEMPQRAGTGVTGLDTILHGGLPRGWTYMVHGMAGTGKTTLGLHFLLDGVRAGEKCLYISLMQSREELAGMARSHGWKLDGIEFLQLPDDVRTRATAEQTVFTPTETELTEVSEAVLDGVREHEPDRLVLDSFSELAVLAADHQQLRGPTLRVKDLLQRSGCTALVACGEIGEYADQLKTILHGVIELDMSFPSYGEHRRRLKVTKMRSMPYLSGHHDFRIHTGGMEVYPRLETAPRTELTEWSTVASGIEELDAMVGGGLEEGTACLITGTSGAGKSTLASLYVQAAAKRGHHAVIFCFDERRETFLRRAESLGMHMPQYIEEGLVDLRQVGAGEMSPGQFSHAVRKSVEESNSRVVVIDSISGLLSAMPEHGLLTTQLHELLNYLSGSGVLSLLVMATHGIINQTTDPVQASHVADAVIALRHFEAMGEIRRCVGVLKKRHGDHEKTIRELRIEAGGCRVGPPLTEFSGVLTRTPTYTGSSEQLMSHNNSPEAGQNDEC